MSLAFKKLEKVLNYITLGLLISKLPPVLMLQFKRFQYNYYKDANEKILDECKYPE